MKANYIGIVAGIFAFICLALFVVLPCWTMPMSGTVKFETVNGSISASMSGDLASVNPYDVRSTIVLKNVSFSGTPFAAENMTAVNMTAVEALFEQGLTYSVSIGSYLGFPILYGYMSLALIAMAGVLAVVGSITVGKNGKIILLVAGTLALLSIIIFVAGLPGVLANLPKALEQEAPFFAGFPKVGLIGSGSFTSTSMGGAPGIPTVTVRISYSSNLSIGLWLALVTAIVTAIIAFVSLLKHPVASLPTETTPKP